MSAPTPETVQGLLAQGQWEKAIGAFQQMAPLAAADFLNGVSFEQQRVLFRGLEHGFAAAVVSHLPYYHAYVLLHSRPVAEMRPIVDRMDAARREAFLDELPEETWKHFMDELAQAYSHVVAQPVTAPKEAPLLALPGSAEAPIIEARRVEKSFVQPEGRRIQVIAPLDLSLRAGTITALLGPSGCGKQPFCESFLDSRNLPRERCCGTAPPWANRIPTWRLSFKASRFSLG